MEPVDGTPQGDPLLDQAMDMVAESKRPQNAQHWVVCFANIRSLRHLIAEQLCRRGVLKEREDTILWIFTRKAYPEIDPRPEMELVKQLREAILKDSQKVPPRTAVVLSLAHAAQMLGIHFERRELKQRKRRIEQIANAEAVGEATKAAMEAAAAEAAVTGAVACCC